MRVEVEVRCLEGLVQVCKIRAQFIGRDQLARLGVSNGEENEHGKKHRQEMSQHGVDPK